MPMSIVITILTGSDAPMMTAQVSYYLLTCGLCGVRCKTSLVDFHLFYDDSKFQDKTQC